MAAKRIPVETRFWQSVLVGAGDDCWEWMGPPDVFGYGNIKVDGRNAKAHRVAYELLVGPIPDGLILRHRCDNPSCVRPSHLEPGTQVDNIKDRDERGRTCKGERHYAVKLTDQQVQELRALYVFGETQVGLARRFRISQSQVSNIIRQESR